MANRPLPSPEALRQLLQYSPTTGYLFWRRRPERMFSERRYCSTWNAKYAGRRAFTTSRAGYWQGAIQNRLFYAHRVVWAIVHDEWPEEVIDHINGDGLDNRAENLRSVSRGDNQKNLSRAITNTSGHTGVHWSNSTQTWHARVQSEGKAYFLGSFANKDDAVEARLRANEQFGFHENHGR